MRKAIWLFLLMPFVVSCKTSGNAADEAEHTSDILVLITAIQPLSRPIIAIRNNTTSELRVWQNGNSWGWWNLSFCVVADDGRVIHLQRSKSTAFTSNGPAYEAIAPGSEVTRNRIDFYDGDWELPKDFNLDKVRYISAIYFVQPTKESAEKGVWTGIVVSPWVTPEAARRGGRGATVPTARATPRRKPER
jgi:hypothetical protein